ncbi:MAG: hypothetical protein NXI31_10315 [bacterium]|nr:hypothetical protein [bacterium]
MLASPRRITVVILAAAVGLGLEQFTALEHAFLPALLAGMVLAMFVPSKSACAVRLPATRTESPREAPKPGD